MQYSAAVSSVCCTTWHIILSHHTRGYRVWQNLYLYDFPTVEVWRPSMSFIDQPDEMHLIRLNQVLLSNELDHLFCSCSSEPGCPISLWSLSVLEVHPMSKRPGTVSEHIEHVRVFRDLTTPVMPPLRTLPLRTCRTTSTHCNMPPKGHGLPSSLIGAKWTTASPLPAPRCAASWTSSCKTRRPASLAGNSWNCSDGFSANVRLCSPITNRRCDASGVRTPAPLSYFLALQHSSLDWRWREDCARFCYNCINAMDDQRPFLEENYRNLDRKQRREKTLHTVPSRPLVQQTALYDSHWSNSPPSPPWVLPAVGDLSPWASPRRDQHDFICRNRESKTRDRVLALCPKCLTLYRPIAAYKHNAGPEAKPLFQPQKKLATYMTTPTTNSTYTLASSPT